MEDLSNKKCIPCSGDVPALTPEEINELKGSISSTWLIIDNHHLERTYSFDNFVDALAFTNKIGGLAESEGHHPDITLSWGKVKLIYYTHKVNGLTESDFIIAAKSELLYSPS